MSLPNLPTGIENKCNTILTNLVTALAPIQTAYHSTPVVVPGQNGEPDGSYVRNRYWQGLPTHATPPADGAKVAPTKTSKPTDQPESWADVAITLPATMECSTTVNVYDGPQGQGYEIVGAIVIAGKTYQRTINVGPETHRDNDWHLVTPA